MNYYVLLGVARDASGDTIRRAFRALARQYHPDAGTGSSPERFRDIVNAYETLSDPVRRKTYDQSLRAPVFRSAHPGVRVTARPAPEPLIPEPSRRPVTLRPSAQLPDETLEQLFADDLFEMIDRLFFRSRRW
jgi:curved DNA-binding protein CbpA